MNSRTKRHICFRCRFSQFIDICAKEYRADAVCEAYRRTKEKKNNTTKQNEGREKEKEDNTSPSYLVCVTSIEPCYLQSFWCGRIRKRIHCAANRNYKSTRMFRRREVAAAADNRAAAQRICAQWGIHLPYISTIPSFNWNSVRIVQAYVRG